MKELMLVFFVMMSSSSCNSQSNIPINNVFINEFIVDNKEDIRYFKNDTLNIYGKGTDYRNGKIYVNFLNFNEVKDRVEKRGEFNLIEMSEIKLTNNLLKVEFMFLTALSEENEDFSISDNTNSFYCIKYSSRENKFTAFWCGNDE